MKDENKKTLLVIGFFCLILVGIWLILSISDSLREEQEQISFGVYDEYLNNSNDSFFILSDYSPSFGLAIIDSERDYNKITFSCMNISIEFDYNITFENKDKKLEFTFEELCDLILEDTHNQ